MRLAIESEIAKNSPSSDGGAGALNSDFARRIIFESVFDDVFERICNAKKYNILPYPTTIN